MFFLAISTAKLNEDFFLGKSEDLYTGPAAHTPIQQQYTSSYSPQQQQSMQPQMTGYSNPSYQQPYSNSLSPSTYLMPQYTSQAPTMMQPTYTGMPNQNQQYMQTGYPGQQYPQRCAFFPKLLLFTVKIEV